MSKPTREQGNGVIGTVRPADAAGRSGVAQKLSLETIRYASVWEDYRLLVDGLKVAPDDDLLVVASAGDNALALLLEEPRSLVAVDMSPAQTALLELKLAAIRHLDHAEFLELLGTRSAAQPALVARRAEPTDGGATGPGPIDLYERLRSHLPAAAASFWDARGETLEGGLLHSGRLDRYFRTFQTEHLPELWAPDLVRRLFAAPDLERQAALFEGEAFTAAFQERFRWYFGRHMMASHGRDPALFEYVLENDVGDYFLGRFHDVCTRLPLRGNFYVERFLTGHCSDLEHATPSLRPKAFARLKGLIRRVRVVTSELEQFLSGTPTQTYSKAALSDVFEYMSEDATAALFSALADHMRPQGRVAYWNLLVPRQPPAELADRLVSRAHEAHRLWLQDRAWFYRAFLLDEVAPAGASIQGEGR